MLRFHVFVLICVLGHCSAAPVTRETPPTAVLHQKTDRLLDSLRHYEMVIPTMVNHRGEFLSYHLHHTTISTTATEDKLGAVRRNKRHAGETFSNSLSNSIDPEHGSFYNRPDGSSEKPGGGKEGTNKHVYYKLSAYGQEFHFNLTLNKQLLSKDFIVERWDRHGPQFRHRTAQPCHYTGQSQTPTPSRAAISNCNGLHGVFTTEYDDYFVEPLWNHTNTIEVDGHPHIVYKRSSLKLHEGRSHCGVSDKTLGVKDKWFLHKSLKPLNKYFKWNGHSDNDSNDKTWKYRRRTQGPDSNTVPEKEENAVPGSEESNIVPVGGEENTVPEGPASNNVPGGEAGRSGRTRRSVSRERHVETLVVVDKMMVGYHGQQEIEAYVLTIMNIVAKLYHDPSIGNAIDVIITRLVLLTEEQPNLFISYDADRSLDSFCRWQLSINPPQDGNRGIAHHDNAILLTRYDICTYKNEPCGTLGLAPVAGMCEEDRSCSINEDIGLASAFTIAHEIGHNFGMQHDGAGNPCGTPGHEPARIMAAQLTRDTSPFLWSNCSKEYITNFLDSGRGRCLENVPKQGDLDFPTDLPGEHRTFDEQCKLQYGSRSVACKLGEVCRELWCMNTSDRCVTNSIPAAEGTHCSSKRITKGWCYRGKCVKVGFRPKAVDGNWGRWSTWGSCSRSCGGGVKSSQRECNNPRPEHGGAFCVGQRRRYKSCNIQDCPSNSTDFRIVQCSKYNSVPFRGKYYQWKPFTGVSVKPCALNCLAEGYNFYTERAPKVIDGTRCLPDNLNMCINGDCRHVGCDKKLGSPAIEDKCRVCDGDGSTCKTTSGIFDERLPTGAYHEVVRIPIGAVRIRIEEVKESKNYLALKSEGDSYYINGAWTIDWPREFPVSGTVFHYERKPGSTELMHALGPTSENLVIMILLQEENLGVHYQYNVPTFHNGAEHDYSRFIWQLSPWSQCSATCAKGTSESRAMCVRKDDKTAVDNHYCPPHLRPDDLSKPCKLEPCTPEWTVGQWSDCSKSCGGGVSSRTVMCTQAVDHTEQDVIEDVKCGRQKPGTQKRCNDETCPPTWFTDEWSQCKPRCGLGEKSRNVYCMSSDGRAYQEDSHCDPNRKPPPRIQCNNGDCPPPTWVTGEWGQCSGKCGKGQQRRSVQCRTYTGEPSQKCHPWGMPKSSQQCEAPCIVTDDHNGECVDTYSVAYCPLVLRFRFCNREYFRNICCKTCETADKAG